jgi:hypothetical protein
VLQQKEIAGIEQPTLIVQVKPSDRLPRDLEAVHQPDAQRGAGDFERPT